MLIGTTNNNGAFNTGVGFDVLKNITGTFPSATSINNTAVGYKALSVTSTGGNNTAIGSTTLAINTTGLGNTAIGSNALENSNSSFNTAVGMFALNTTSSGQNTAIGYSSLYENISGTGNTAIGLDSLVSSTGNNNTAIGDNAGTSLTTGSNNTIIGYNAQSSTASISNQITLGNSSIGSLRCQVTSITALSDARDKKNIKDITAGLDFINNLHPVEFIWNMRDKGKIDIPEIGFIAQELQETQIKTGITIPNLVYDINPDKLEASYGVLIPILVKAIQELNEKLSKTNLELSELKNIMNNK